MFSSLRMILLFCLVPSVVQAQNEINEKANNSIYITGFIFLFIAVIFFISWLGSRERKQDRVIKAKIGELRQKGQELHLRKTEALTAEDIRLLERHSQMAVTAVTLVMGIMAVLMFVFGNFIFYIIGAVLVIAIYPIRKSIQSSMQKVIDQGQKQVIRGIITDRYTTTKSSGKSQTTNYWLKIGDIIIEVNATKYGHYTVGDAAEFHTVNYPAGKTHVIRDQKLEGAGLR